MPRKRHVVELCDLEEAKAYKRLGWYFRSVKMDPKTFKIRFYVMEWLQ
jgi:hypothetical protein